MCVTSEDVLNSWLKLSTSISNERVAAAMPYNELLICGILYRNQKSARTVNITATDLCKETRMLKSQMNRTLNSMERKGLITRQRSTQDRRQVYITFCMDHAEIYEREHERILAFVDALLDKIGWWRADDIIKLLSLISETADEVIK